MGRLELAGQIWGAIEAEERRAPLGQWDQHRGEYAEPLLARATPEFERGREQGRRLSLAAAIELALEGGGSTE